jgi:hypothetical protein
MKPLSKPPGTKRLKLKYGRLLSTYPFRFNLRRYIMVATSLLANLVSNLATLLEYACGRGLHSSASQLNLSRF